MRVLIFSPYFPPHVGGVEAYVSELNEELLAASAVDEIVVLTPQLPDDALARERHDAIAIVRFPAFEAVPNYPVPRFWTGGFGRAVRAAIRSRPDVVVSHTRFFLTSAMAMAYARASGVRWVHVEHGADFVQLDGRVAGRVARIYDETLGRLVLRSADARVAVSEAARVFVAALAKRDARVIHRGVRRELIDAVAPSAAVHELSDGRVPVAYVGRLIDGKGVADLVEATRALGRSDFELFVVGDGPRRHELEQAAPANVRFLGYLPEPEAIAVIKAAEIVVNPSYTEGLPTTVLLAALCGRAVVATDVGGTREIIDDVLVPAGRPDVLASALGRLLDNPDLRASVAAAARENARARFDWHDSVAAFADTLRG